MLSRYVALLCLSLWLAWTGLAQDPDSPDPKQRARAAESLAGQGSAALPALAKLLKDPEVKVRREAVVSIVKIGTQHSLEPLVEATRDNDPEVQIWAAGGLVNFYLPGYVGTGLAASLKRTGASIKGRFTDTNDQVIRADMQVRPEVVEALGRLARGGVSMESRAHAARAAGILRAQAAVPDLLEALRSKDSGVIYESLIALQKIRDTSAGAGIAFLLRDLDPRVQAAAIETTGLLQYRAALPQLYEILESDRHKRVHRATLTAIAMMPDEASRPRYSRFITDKDPAMRAAAAEGFARLRNTAYIASLQSHFDAEEKMNPRLSLAFALVMLGKTEVGELTPLQYLVNTLNSSSYRGVALPFLLELAREESVRRGLYQALSAGTRREKTGIAQVLASSGDAESISHLEALSRDPDAEVALEGTQSLRVLRARLK